MNKTLFLLLLLSVVLFCFPLSSVRAVSDSGAVMMLTVNVSIKIPERSQWSNQALTTPYSLEWDIATVFKNDTGKISASGTSVTGTGTHFKEDFVAGQYISTINATDGSGNFVYAETHKILSITDDTHMTTEPWTYAITNLAYTGPMLAGNTGLYGENTYFVYDGFDGTNTAGPFSIPYDSSQSYSIYLEVPSAPQGYNVETGAPQSTGCNPDCTTSPSSGGFYWGTGSDNALGPAYCGYPYLCKCTQMEMGWGDYCSTMWIPPSSIVSETYYGGYSFYTDITTSPYTYYFWRSLVGTIGATTAGAGGSPCTKNSDCTYNNCSSSGICGGNGAYCDNGHGATPNPECQSTICNTYTSKCSSGELKLDSCTLGSDCASGFCNSKNHICSDGIAGGICAKNADCQYANCATDGICGDLGTACDDNSGTIPNPECASGYCNSNNNLCSSGVAGTSCAQNSDCTNSNCASDKVCGDAGATCTSDTQCVSSCSACNPISGNCTGTGTCLAGPAGNNNCTSNASCLTNYCNGTCLGWQPWKNQTYFRTVSEPAAASYCANLMGDGRTEAATVQNIWRLPSIGELITGLEGQYQSLSPTYIGFFKMPSGNSSSYYWSSTIQSSTGYYAVAGMDGYNNINSTYLISTSSNYVICYATNISITGQSCTIGANCASGYCNTATDICTTGANGSGCGQNSDCSNNNCASDGICGDTGSRVNGSTCIFNSNCASNFCDQGTHLCAAGTNGGTCTSGADCTSNFCAPATPICLGQSCTQDSDCGLGSSCNGSTHSCIAGNFCSGLSGCGSAYYCDFLTNTCTEAPPASCSSNSQCPSSYNCGFLNSPSTCLPGTVGSSCDFGSDCASGWCSLSIPKDDLGGYPPAHKCYSGITGQDFCTSDGMCRSGYCDGINMVCLTGALFSSCLNDYQCASGFCGGPDHHTCVACAPQSQCDTDGDCGSGSMGGSPCNNYCCGD